MTIVVDRQGDTIYELGNESLNHLQCITSGCLKQFTPVMATSYDQRIPVGPGVHGHVSIMHRPRGGFYQVMLSDHPLYFYSGDHTIGQATDRASMGRAASGTWLLAARAN